MGDKLRIYVGGLGPRVEEVDLKKTFTSAQLGAVQSVEIIRTKGRSFAYLEFVPASDKGLAKLFSTYSGCLWKGGRLKLEKAKEDYLARLRREWAEDSQIEIDLFCQNIDEDESAHATQKPKKDSDIDKLQLNIFFPKLRKIKPIPLKGTGKHKYSFQRVEVPPLPTHFCDCEEHSAPPEVPKRNYVNNDEMDNYVVNENELNMMKSILSKFLEKETRSEGEVTEKKNNDASLADNLQVDESEEDQVSDEDNLVINIVGTKSKRIDSFEDWGQKIATSDQVQFTNSLVKEMGSFSNSTWEMHGTEKGKHNLHKKRKQSIPEDKSNDIVSPKKKGKKGIDDLVVEKTEPIVKESGSFQLSGGVKKSNKSAWKALISDKGSTVFNVSDIVTTLNSEGENKPISDENDGQQGQSSQYKEPKKLSDDQTAKKTASVDNSGGQATADQNSLVREPVSFSNPTSETHGTEKGKHILPKKRKQSILEDKSNDKVSPKMKGKKWNQHDSIDNLVVENTQRMDKDSDSVGDVKKSNKSSGKALISEKGSIDFNESDIVTTLNSEGENKSMLDENGGQQDHSSQYKEPEKVSDDQTTKKTASVDNSGRGSSWLQKSSWLQLIGDANSSAFNLAHILPEATLEKQEWQQSHELRGGESPVGEPQRRADTASPGFDVGKGKNDGAQLNSDSNPSVDADLAPYDRPVGDIVISETCPFMKSNASMKEWIKSKAALSESHKKKDKGKESR